MLLFHGFLFLFHSIGSWIFSMNMIYRGLERDMNGEERAGDVMLIGAISVAILLVHGIISVRIPLKRLRGENRMRNMQRQGGHTLMLCYFLGFGAFSESLLMSSTRKFRVAANRQLCYLSIPQSIIQILSLYFLQNIILDHTFTITLIYVSLFVNVLLLALTKIL